MAKLDRALAKMVQSNASDLHLSSGEPVRTRIDGDLYPTGKKPLTTETLAELMKEICREDQWRKFVQSNELDFAYSIPKVGRFRCNYLRQARGLGAVFRVIPEKISSLEDLKMPPAVVNIPAIRRGLVLVTGPTGSGKSTTLAAMIDRINHAVSRHVITIEDPVEFLHWDVKSHIVQREVGLHSPSFSAALQDALIQDPDVILVGEMRDLETISLAVTAAEMGVLVFATVHTNSAAKTFDRIIDAFPQTQQEQIRGMLAESLRAIVSQQLLRRRGDRGRVAALEILLDGPGLANIIRTGNATKIHGFIEAGRAAGMQTMDDALHKLIDTGSISIGDAYLKCHDKARFEEWAKSQDVELE